MQNSALAVVLATRAIGGGSGGGARLAGAISATAHSCMGSTLAAIWRRADDNENAPDTYLGKFWVDSITHDPRLLRYILEMQGSDRICMGTDYPFPLGDLEFGQFMEEMGLNESARMQLFSGSVLSWLGMDASHFD